MKKKNQWTTRDIKTNKVSYLKVGVNIFKKFYARFTNFIRGLPLCSKLKILFQSGLTVLISVLIIYGVAQAGTITPPAGAPSAQFYTLSEIYTRLTTNATSTEGSHNFDFSDPLAKTGHTLTEIYNAIPTIVANTVKSGTSYLGVAGTLVPSGGDATTANVLAGKTFFGANQTDWNLSTGTMTNVGKQTITPGVSNVTITQGYHNGTGYCAGDPDLVAGNIKSGIDLFGVLGDYPSATHPLPGDTEAGDAVAGNILSGLEAWTKAGSLLTGTMTNVGKQIITPGTSNVTITQGYHNGTGYCAGDADLVAGNIKSGANIFGIAGDPNVVDTSSGDAVAGNILSGKKAWVDGKEIMGNFASQEKTATTEGQEVKPDSGDWLSQVTVAITNLTANNIKKDAVVGGVTGTYSGYPGTGWTGTGGVTDAKSCEDNSGWYWFEDANGNGTTTDPEDGICVQASPVTAVWSWNGAEQIVPNTLSATTINSGSSNSVTVTNAGWTTDAYKNHLARVEKGSGGDIDCWGRVKTNTADTITVYGSWLKSDYTACATTPGNGNTVKIINDDKYDNSWIGDWTCKHGDHALDGTVVWHSYPTSAQVGDTNHIALATTDCYDGVRDLLPIVDESANDSRIVWSGTANSGDDHTLNDSDASWDANVWIGEKVKIFSGTSAGSEGIIESNTDTALTVGSWSNGNPGSSSQYGIIYIIPHASYRPDISSVATENNGPLKANALNNWKGSRLPSSSDFFGLCGSGGTAVKGDYKTNCSNNKYFGNYGGQIGRTDECLSKANSGNWEWLSEQNSSRNARVAGHFACSYFSSNSVYNGYRFRGVFRP